MEYHRPVLLTESVEGMLLDPSGSYVDVTFGGGGHSREIVSRLADDGKLLAFDQDNNAQQNLIDDERFYFAPENFKFIRNFVRFFDFGKVDGILADLGVSSHHFDTADRGFSFRFEESALDMRMDQSAKLSAADILNTYTEEKLAQVFWEYGELKNSRKLARLIVEHRKTGLIQTSNTLKELAVKCKPKTKEHKYFAQIYQALRIEVNDEMAVLRDLLEASVDVLKPGGRIAVITYHSLEDRMVKNFFKTGNIKGDVEKDFFGQVQSPFTLVNRKVILPSDTEQKENSRSRSAKLRIAERNY